MAVSALLRRELDGEVVLWERAAGSDAGFGVVLPIETRATAARIAPALADGLAARSVRWRRTSVCREGETWSTELGPEFAAIGRAELNALLQEVCAEAGVRLRHGDAPGVDALSRTHDLVVLADGAGSIAGSVGFGVSLRPLGPRYAWLGLDRAVDGLEFRARTTSEGCYTAHVYPYSGTASTFLVEGPRALPDDRIGELFGERVRPAAGPGGFGWRSFRERTVTPWSKGNVVVVGDAAHTVHYSVGHGTRLALDDAVALADALAGAGTVADALASYERDRRPAVELAQERGRISAEWFTGVGDRLELSLPRFAASLVTRGGRLADPDHGRNTS